MLEEGFGLEDWRAGKALASARAPAWASQFLVLSARWAGSRQDVGGERLASRAQGDSVGGRVCVKSVKSSQVKFASNFLHQRPIRLPGSTVRVRFRL